MLKRKYTRLRVVLSVGGGGKGSERFAQTSLALVQQFGIDGIDSQYIDPEWQYFY